MTEDKRQFVSSPQNEETGTFEDNMFFYWGLHLRHSLIILRKMKKRIDKIINLIAYLAGFIGIASFGYWIYIFQEMLLDNPWRLLFFWQYKHYLILIFLISIFFDMFTIYRFSEAKMALRKIRRFKVGKGKKGDNFKRRFDVSGGLNEDSLAIVEDAFLIAKRLKQKELSVIHLFRSLLLNRDIRSIFIRLNVDMKALVSKLDKYLIDPEVDLLKFGRVVKFSNNAKEVLIEAYLDAYNLKQESIKPLNLFLFCLSRNRILEEILYDIDIDQDKIDNIVAWFRGNDKMIEDFKKFRRMARLKPGSTMNKSYTALATPILNKFSYDITLHAKYGRLEPCVAREKEIKDIFNALESGKTGVMITGSVGVGKRTIVDGIAQLMVKEEVPRFLKDRRLVELNASAMLSGATPVQAQERLLIAINEVIRSGNTILFIENVENLIGITAGDAGSLELSEVLAESLSRKDIYVIATATSQNFSKYVEGTALSGAMTIIGIDEPDNNTAIQMLESKASFLENKHKIYFSYNSIEQAVKYSAKYINDKFLPAKAIDVLKATAVQVSKRCAKDNQCFCTAEDIAKAMSELTGIPVTKISESESQKLLDLEKNIHKRMINQVEAVNAVAASLRRARAEMRDGKRPIANFLFLGPTGVGKTELAKSVSDIYFGDEDYMIRIDMSEYQHPDSVKKMIGDSSGVLGYLTEAVRKKPFSLILLDEIEKAHPDILNLFLQMMDDGRLTDGQGRTVSFTNSIIIATSNAGALYIQGEVKKGTDMSIIRQGLIDDHLNKVMRPELINRFDGLIVFTTLSKENIFDITKLMLNKIAKVLEKKGIALRTDDKGVKILADLGYDPKFGARPLRRLLQSKVENIIANKILSKELKRRDVVVINEKAEIVIEKGRVL